MQPLVSVVIPAYNRSQKLIRALTSVQNQTYQNWQAVVVDDGSKDDTEQIVHEMAQQDGRISYVRHEFNEGSQASRNTGIRSSRGEWVAFLDSDDELLPESLSSRLEIALKEDSNAVHSHAFIVHRNQPMIPYYSPQYRGDIYKDILIKDGPMFPSLMVQKKALESIGYLDETIQAFQEWDTYIRLAKFCKFSFLPKETFIYYYTSEDSISRDDRRGAKGYLQIMNKHFMEILKHGGARAIGFHYMGVAKLFKTGGDNVNFLRYRFNAMAWKCLSLSVIFKKIRMAGRS